MVPAITPIMLFVFVGDPQLYRGWLSLIKPTLEIEHSPLILREKPDIGSRIIYMWQMPHFTLATYLVIGLHAV